MRLIVIGSAIFIAVLAISAFWEPDIRWLHFFQAWIYIVAVALSVRRNRWGYFIGGSAAAFWMYATLFINGFFVSGLKHLVRLDRPDQVIAVPGWIGNALVLIGCALAYWRMKKPASDVARFALAFILTTGFFALDMALFQPRYLAIFPRLLHPHLPT